MLTRRSFLTGLIAAPVIVHIGNIMPVRGIPEQYLFDKPFQNLSIEDLCRAVKFMKEANIPAFARDTIAYAHYKVYISQTQIDEGRRRFRAANPHYGCHISGQMALDFL